MSQGKGLVDASFAESALCVLEDTMRKENEAFQARLQAVWEQGRRYTETLQMCAQEFAVARDNLLAHQSNELVGEFKPDEHVRCQERLKKQQMKVEAFFAIQKQLLEQYNTQDCFDELLSVSWRRNRANLAFRPYLQSCPTHYEPRDWHECYAQIFLDSGTVAPSSLSILCAIKSDSVNNLSVLLQDPRTKARWHDEDSRFKSMLSYATKVDSDNIVTELLRLSQTPEWAWVCDAKQINVAFFDALQHSNLKTFYAFVQNAAVFQTLSCDHLQLAMMDHDLSEQRMHWLLRHPFFSQEASRDAFTYKCSNTITDEKLTNHFALHLHFHEFLGAVRLRRGKPYVKGCDCEHCQSGKKRRDAFEYVPIP